MQEYIIINEKDNVAVALADLKAGTVIKAKEKEVVVKEDIMRGHKVTLCDIPQKTWRQAVMCIPRISRQILGNY